MKSRLILAAIALVSALALATPLAAAQSDVGQDTPGREEIYDDGKYCFDAAAGTDVSCVVLYAHIFDLLNRILINVQYPPDCAVDLARGFTAFPTVEPIYDFNQLVFFSSPGFVEYGIGGCKDPRQHQERGLSYDVEISDIDIPIKGYFYLSADTDEYSMLGGDIGPTQPDTGVMPCVTMRMVLESGASIGGGDIIAEGQTTRTLINSAVIPPQSLPVTEHQCPDSVGTIDFNKVTEFEIELSKPTMDIPRIKAFVVWVEWWQHDTGSQKVAQREWNVHTGNVYKTRVVIPFKNPIKVEQVRPQFFDNKIYVHTSFNSPWGSYDVDPGSINVEVLDANGQTVPLKNLKEPLLRYSVDHDGHFKPVNATFPWEFQKENLAPGDYTIRVTAQNWQWTASTSKDATVKIGESLAELKTISSEGQEIRKLDASGKEIGDLAKDSPGAAVGALLALIGVALFGMRRRHE